MNRKMNQLLDGQPAAPPHFTEKQVRDMLADFNARVIDARRQLQGGPPVITKTRDVDAEVARWNERRAARAPAAQPEPEPTRSWWQRFWRRTA